jgi:hypothetical protein
LTTVETYDEARIHKSEAGKRGAKIMHANRRIKEREDKIREIWASGKYRTRDECAACEWKEVGLGLSTARRALIRTPEPAMRLGRTG